MYVCSTNLFPGLPNRFPGPTITFPVHYETFPGQKMYELICAKMSIFPSKRAQETIQYGQEMYQDAQEMYHRVQ